MSATSTDDSRTGTLRILVTVLALLGFCAFVVLMLRDAEKSSEIVWSRRVYLLSGVEAIVFAAVGWLFGREVHRSEAQTAKEDAAQAKEKAATAEEEAKASLQVATEERTKGMAVRAAARRMAPPLASDGSQIVGLDQPSSGATRESMLVGLVEELWPTE